MPLYRNLRFYIICFSLILSAIIFTLVHEVIPPGTLQTIRLTQIYALTALTYVYIALLATPLTRILPDLPFRGQYIFVRRALGVSAFYFAALHASFAFWGQLGGFAGLPFLSDTYIQAITLSFTALVILTAMAVTSFDKMIVILGFSTWKLLHRFVYLASLLILIHALMLGTHFRDLSGVIPRIIFFAVSFLLYLEALRFDDYLQKLFPWLMRGLVQSLTVGLLSFIMMVNLTTNSSSFNIHQQHTSSSTSNNSMPAMNHTPPRDNKRYTVSFLHPEAILPNVDTQLKFKVFDADSGNPVNLFTIINDKLAHLIIVDNYLQEYQHIHPQQTDNEFSITAQFPHPGTYHVYLDFRPFGSSEQQMGFTVDVGTNSEPQISEQLPDTLMTKYFSNYYVTLDLPQPLQANLLSSGQQQLRFTFNHADTHEPVITLQPYLASFGHLVLINQQTYAYYHIHPTDMTAPAPGATAGPTVEFTPMALNNAITPGIYRIFGQFNPDGQLSTIDYTITIQ